MTKKKLAQTIERLRWRISDLWEQKVAMEKKIRRLGEKMAAFIAKLEKS